MQRIQYKWIMLWEIKILIEYRWQKSYTTLQEIHF